MAIYQVPEIMLICSNKHSTFATTAMIRLMFSWVSVIHFIFQYLLYFFFLVFLLLLNRSMMMPITVVFLGWCLFLLFPCNGKLCFINYPSKEYGWSSFWDFLLALIVSSPQVKNPIYRMLPSSKYNHCTFGIYSSHKNNHWVSQQVWRTHY